MFKVGDRVKHYLIQSTVGAIHRVHSNGSYDIRWDNGVTQGPYEVREFLPLITWQVGDEFEVSMDDGSVQRGKLTHTPSNGGKYQGVTVFSSGKTSGVWTFLDDFEQIARLVKSTVTYKSGDKVRYIGNEFASRLANVRGVFVQGMMSTFGRFDFAGEIWGLDLKDVEPWPTALPRPPFSCARCHEPNDYAEPNLPGGGYACFSCRKYHAYALTGT